MLNSALWFRQARMNNTTGCCGSTAPSTKGWGKMLCYKITSSRRTPSRQCVLNEIRVCYILIYFPQTELEKQTSAATAWLTKKWICKPRSKASVCINTKPSLSRRANASLLAHWFQSNYVTEISKYVIYGLESCRRLLIKYAKLYLSTEVWICSGVQSSNHTKGGGMFPWNLPSHCNSSFPPLSNYCWLAICTPKQC